MLFSKRLKSSSLEMISTIILIATVLILSGCGDSNAPGDAQREQITKPVDPIFNDIGKTVLPSVEKPPEVK
ncbi:MAG: hypothetical protein HON76_09755 [Candidatus Scalindua sp.]|jgi:PBP1b-binding outer membrane lipoprotein LpoB|nr:hypothetical protein [Candidatus Scalindua sp.]MBT5303497.1 hypothetical protein [Candidatus Scalindua sp.]MBT6051867.1 hypothetical protein [Candidatus Scalindua sp.]MBT6227343.1 hypothetical protein [Candidatus Scalindua sp.]MBT6562799.1 hypothetical protein [Candidatus Scalindua sp.]